MSEAGRVEEIRGDAARVEAALIQIVERAGGCPIGQGICECPSSDDCVLAQALGLVAALQQSSAAILATLTTQAETIRQLEMANGLLQVERIGHAEKIHDQAETIRVIELELAAEKRTIRRLEGEVHTLAERKAAEYHERCCCVYKQRAEAAEGLSERMYTALNTVHAWASNRRHLEGTAFLRGVCEEFLRPRPATGEGA